MSKKIAKKLKVKKKIKPISRKKITAKRPKKVKVVTKKRKPTIKKTKTVVKIKKKLLGRSLPIAAEPEIKAPNNEEIQALITKGHTRGFVTEEEVLKTFPLVEEYLELFDDFFDTIDELGVQITTPATG